MKLSNLKKILVSTVAFVAVLTLSSCSSDLYVNHKATGGITVAQAEAKLRSLPHITSAAYNMESWDDNGEGGLGATSGMNIIVNITVDPAYHISDPTAFLSFVSKTIWAANDKYPKGSVLLEVNGGLSPNYDWSDAYKTVLGIKYDRFDSQNEADSEQALKWCSASFPAGPAVVTVSAQPDTIFAGVTERSGLL
jgi:hypothetical protein